MQHGIQHGKYPAQYYQAHTELGAHDAGVMKGKADGHIAVIGHDHKKEVFHVSKNHEKVHLCQATHIGDGWNLALHVLQQLWHCDKGKTEVREGQITEKQVHGCMQVGVQ